MDLRFALGFDTWEEEGEEEVVVEEAEEVEDCFLVRDWSGLFDLPLKISSNSSSSARLVLPAEGPEDEGGGALG